MNLPLPDLLLAFGKSFLLVVATLLPIVNPPSTAPLFLSLTEGASDATRKLLAQRVARNVFLLMAAGTVVGSFVLDFFGISLDIVRVGGGLLVSAIAWRLINTNQAGSPPAERLAEAYTPEMVNRTAFYPLSFPLTCGPGSLAATITVGVSLVDPSLTATAARSAGAAVGLLVVALVTFLCYRYAQALLRPLGETGTIVFLRLSAFILLCLGIQIFWSGAGALLAEAVQRGMVPGAASGVL